LQIFDELGRLTAKLRTSLFIRHFSLSMSAQPCYNPIEIQSSRRAVSCREKQGAHPEESFPWPLPMTAPKL
jgi:hypothetical protein